MEKQAILNNPPGLGSLLALKNGAFGVILPVCARIQLQIFHPKPIYYF